MTNMDLIVEWIHQSNFLSKCTSLAAGTDMAITQDWGVGARFRTWGEKLTIIILVVASPLQI